MKKLAIHGGEKVLDDALPHYNWPIIDDTIEKDVLTQLRKEISIYDCSGIIEKFERKWKSYHKTRHALLTNSGTSALFSLFVGIGLEKGDEIICPNYTFFATISSVISLGVKPIFCDCDISGNIDIKLLESIISSKTKAIIVTHMWGIPCEMDSIVRFSKKHNIKLLEDCSHSHGAKYKNKLVGTFGIGAAWSLQGQKLVSGGEGGILTTNSDEVYYRALLIGHYNKRCKNEIPEEFHLSKYCLTGFGHKFRSHPLAVTIALNQFNKLDSYLKIKQGYALQIIRNLEKVPFLEMPNIDDRLPSWYAFVMLYDKKKANNIDRKTFIRLLKSEGLREIDIPNSTCPLNQLPLFKSPNNIYPYLYDKNNTKEEDEYLVSNIFYNSAIKLPVWALKNNSNLVLRYIEGILKVSYHVLNYPNKLKM